MRRTLTPDLQRQGVSPGTKYIRCLCKGTLLLRAREGHDTRCVVRFNEVESGLRWRRGARANLGRVASNLGLLARVDQTNGVATLHWHAEPRRGWG
jgi:hypothetical protein